MNRRIPFVLVLSLLFLLPAWAGCTSSEAQAVSVREPRLGLSALYQAEDGTRLYVNLTKVEHRLNQRGQAQEAAIFNLSRQLADQNNWSYFEEAVDPSTGLVVQRVALCGRPNGTDSTTCYDERVAVLWGGSGTPGALGLGPLWGDTLSAGNQTVQKTLQIGRQPSIAGYKFQRNDTAGCTVIQPPVRDDWTSSLPSGVQSSTVCRDAPLPAAFITQEGRVYRLQTLEGGTENIPGASPEWRPGGAIPRRTWTGPLVVNDPSDPSNFTVEEAHQEALDRSEVYATFWDRDPSALVIASNTFWEAGGSFMEISSEERVSRRLLAVSDDGSYAEVEIREDQRDGIEYRYTVTSEDTGTLDRGVSRQTLSDHLLSFGPALDTAKDLVREDIAFQWYGAFTERPRHPYLPPGSSYPEGYTFWSLHDEPGEPESVDTGVAIFVPQYFVVNGAEGTLVLAETSKSHFHEPGPLR